LDVEKLFSTQNFIKDQDELQHVKDILHENFRMIQIVYIESLVGSPSTYPEIGFEYFARALQD